jgi:hypothetical protein
MFLFWEKPLSQMQVSGWVALATGEGVALGWNNDTSALMRSLSLNPKGKVCRRVRSGRSSCLRPKISHLQAHHKVCNSRCPTWNLVPEDIYHVIGIMYPSCALHVIP